jgi:hypothetical protein
MRLCIAALSFFSGLSQSEKRASSRSSIPRTMHQVYTELDVSNTLEKEGIWFIMCILRISAESFTKSCMAPHPTVLP